MKTVPESALEGGRFAKDRRNPVARVAKLPPIPIGKSISPEDELENTLTAELRVGLRNGKDASHANGRQVLLDKAVAGYRIVLIREQADPLSGINLSPREREIARLISKGYPNKAIAAVLEISCWTVGTHLRRVFAKLGVTSRAAMVARLMELGLRRDS
jgi:DNA-binding CsgD family transcriptional regulator